MKHKKKKIKSGVYEYRSFIINSLGYHHPDKSVVWECGSDIEEVRIHGFSLSEAIFLIDQYYDDNDR